MAASQAPPEMSLALDNDVFTHWRSQQPYALKEITAYQSRHKVVSALTSTTVFEALSGIEAEAAKNKNVEQYRIRAEQLIQNCIVLPFDQNAAAIAAYVFPRLSQGERKWHWRDVFIAATAIAHRYGVATGNKKDFELIDKHLPPGHRLYLAIWKP
jgi:predicted nucleic acid-binding protein